MMYLLFNLFVLLAAPDSPAPVLLTHDQLQAELGRPGLRILDTRPRAAYDKAHIPGSLWVDAAAWTRLSSKPGGLDDLPAWEALIKPLGLLPGMRVIIVDGARQIEAAKLWWLLRYLGVPQVSLLDGNFNLWEQAGRPLTTDSPEIENQPFPVAFQKSRLATRDDVLNSLKNHAARVIDVRSTAEFTGKQKLAKRAGHIPDACHLEWSLFVAPDGRFLPEAELLKRIDAAAIPPGVPVITHCQGGGRASLSAFVFERLGFPTRNYYASWNDWGNAEDTPIVTPPPENTPPDPPPSAGLSPPAA